MRAINRGSLLVLSLVWAAAATGGCGDDGLTIEHCSNGTDDDGDGDTTEACAGPGSYGLILELVADGRTVVSTRRADVVVP